MVKAVVISGSLGASKARVVEDIGGVLSQSRSLCAVADDAHLNRTDGRATGDVAAEIIKFLKW
jgi:hypothetical protein